ncbi:type I-E CRISPR-associated endonuclease Cas1 [Streptomyces sp. ISL-1]|uniref:type I-E CRISPR-associated endonuclease Cas1e n=1 Tax=Streptomyces sp. ISL-1 TaxID=2817657 RepID=UPI001BEA4D8B|nr:type I-E CRISPR-associated endonuclease Cas1e [Streptomyces sp. ISL-1]MBT2392366.1 type I-E CRISPR-associated endonuclease Cas1 [Streptomyces sp. ISL-1]
MTTVSRRAALTPRHLTRTSERLSFIYLERCTVHRDANAITAEDADGTTHIPSATIGTLLLGPGTRITHQAMSVLGETGAAVAWVGEQGVRYYASGRALTRSSALAEAQAVQWANVRTRIAVARAMYRLRFPDEDPAGLTRHELLGREGRRVKDCYRAQAARTGIPWRGRKYAPGDFAGSDSVNQALTAAAQCMYGIAHAVVASLGCSSALGFVHSGHELSFVLDIADLYKTELGIPLAFDIAAEDPEDVGPRTRRALRDRINEFSLLDRCVDDIKRLLLPEAKSSAGPGDRDVVTLQSDGGIEVAAGRNYGDGSDEDEAMTW